MAVNLEQVGEWLEAIGIRFDHSTEDEVIVFFHGDDETTQAHYIRTIEDGDVFQWHMNILDDDNDAILIKDHKYSSKVLSHMLYMNYQTKFGTWEYDPNDGEIRLSVEIPLEDALMTEKQFMRIVGFMIKDGQNGADAIRHILLTGKVKEDDSDAALLALMAALSKDMDDKGADSSEDGL